MRPGEAAKRIPSDLAGVIRRSLAVMVATAHEGAEMIAQAAPVDRGTLKASVHVERGGTVARIVLDAPHAGVIEMGSRPHTPPLAPLVAWVKRHHASFGFERGDGGAVGIARAIQRRIAMLGTKPTYFVRRQLPTVRDRLDANLRAALGRR